jgi:subfamily B ATP-binding cassette protein MsbA
MIQLGKKLIRPAASEIRILLALTGDHRSGLTGLVVLGLAASFVDTLGVSLVVFLLYRAVLGRQFPAMPGFLSIIYRWTETVAGHNLYMLGLAIGATVLIRQLFVGAYGIVGARICNGIHDRLRTRLFRQYLTIEWQHMARRPYGELTNTLLNETWRASQAIEQFSRILINASAVFVYVAVLSFISWPVALAGLGTGVIMMALTQMFRGRLRLLSQDATLLHDQMAERMVGAMQAMRTIRAFGLETTEIRRFAETSHAVAAVFVRLAAVDNACRPFLEMATFSSVLAVVWVSNAVGNPSATTIAILALLFRLQPQVREIQGHVISLLSAHASLAVLAAELKCTDKPYPVQGFRPAAGSFQRDITLSTVSFVHAGSIQPALDRVSFTIKRGMTVAITGPSGSGKTTVVNLLLKLYEPTGGVITVDDVPLADIDRSGWLKRVAVTGQDIDLMEGSILDNIRMAHPQTTVEEARAALSIAGILDFVEQLPDGLGTYVGERGLRLSGGQRQRISLARAIAGQPDILVLDEATNAIGSIIEDGIHSALRSMFPWLTIIIVTHRNHPVAEADLAIVLDGGRLCRTSSSDAAALQLEPTH